MLEVRDGRLTTARFGSDSLDQIVQELPAETDWKGTFGVYVQEATAVFRKPAFFYADADQGYP
jgi:hypothetical protein